MDGPGNVPPSKPRSGSLDSSGPPLQSSKSPRPSIDSQQSSKSPQPLIDSQQSSKSPRPSIDSQEEASGLPRPSVSVDSHGEPLPRRPFSEEEEELLIRTLRLSRYARGKHPKWRQQLDDEEKEAAYHKYKIKQLQLEIENPEKRPPQSYFDLFPYKARTPEELEAHVAKQKQRVEDAKNCRLQLPQPAPIGGWPIPDPNLDFWSPFEAEKVWHKRQVQRKRRWTIFAAMQDILISSAVIGVITYYWYNGPNENRLVFTAPYFSLYGVSIVLSFLLLILNKQLWLVILWLLNTYFRFTFELVGYFYYSVYVASTKYPIPSRTGVFSIKDLEYLEYLKMWWTMCFFVYYICLTPLPQGYCCLLICLPPEDDDAIPYESSTDESSQSTESLYSDPAILSLENRLWETPGV